MGNRRDGNIRIGSSEREQAVSALAEHLGEGRLELSEYDHRCGLAASARTRGELEAVFRDLPEPHPMFEPTAPGTDADLTGRSLVEPTSPRRNAAIITGLVVFAVIAIVAVTAITKTWWAFIPMLVVVALLAMFS